MSNTTAESIKYCAQSLNKNERLKSRKVIQSLFRRKSFIYTPNLKIYFVEHPLETKYPIQVCFSVPKRSFPKATDRNKIKRRLKEQYRKKKLPLYNLLAEKSKQLAILIVYQSKEMMDYSSMEKEIEQFLHTFVQKYEVD
ncbi:MAG: ribonuclease P protein component [Chitinophagales bacterium]|nr:ribonuclease P protein component [Chitinophagales bacterium]